MASDKSKGTLDRLLYGKLPKVDPTDPTPDKARSDIGAKIPNKLGSVIPNGSTPDNV